MRFCQRYSVARAIPTPFAATAALNPRPIRRRQRSSASRLTAAALDGGFAAIRRDAARPLRITWPGRPNTCIGGSPEVGVSQLQLRRPPNLTQAPVSHLSETRTVSATQVLAVMPPAAP